MELKGQEQAIIEKYRQRLDAILGEGQWVLTNTSKKVPYDEKLDMGKYELKKGATYVASFQLYPMINCCGICVSTQAEVVPAWRKHGLGTLLNAFRIDTARYLGYGLLLCTDVESNEYQRKILSRNGWMDLLKFINPRTKNAIFVSAIRL